MRSSHSNEKAVLEACALPRKQKNAAFKDLRNEGMKKYNIAEMKKETPVFQRSRSAHRQQSQNLVMCDKCHSFISRGYFYKHKKKNVLIENSNCRPVMANILLPHSTATYCADFKSKVLSNIKNDNIGLACKSDSGIVFFGSRMFEKLKRKVDKEFQIRNTVKLDMCRIGNLFLHFRTLLDESDDRPSTDTCITSETMLNRRYFHVLESAL